MYCWNHDRNGDDSHRYSYFMNHSLGLMSGNRVSLVGMVVHVIGMMVSMTTMLMLMPMLAELADMHVLMGVVVGNSMLVGVVVVTAVLMNDVLVMLAQMLLRCTVQPQRRVLQGSDDGFNEAVHCSPDAGG